MKSIHFFALLAIAGTAVLAGCNKDEEVVTPPAETLLFKGPAQSIGSGTANTWVRTVNGKIDALGINMDGINLAGFGTSPEVFALELPAEAAATGLTFATIDWNPGGHPPMPTYEAPHFDFHFYYLTQNELSAIPGGPDTVAVLPQYIPPTYSYGDAPMAVPGMGVHYMDMSSHEFHNQDFTRTFIYGFYEGNLVFLEPMVTKAFLNTAPSASLFIPQPAAYKRTGLYYPTKYAVKGDTTQHNYVISLDVFNKR